MALNRYKFGLNAPTLDYRMLMLREMTDVWSNKMHLYPYRAPSGRIPLSSLLPWEHSGSLADSESLLLRKICKMAQNLSGPLSQNGCRVA